MAGLEFNFRTGKITIDHALCASCQTHDCVSACQQFGTALFKLVQGLPVLIYPPEETGRRCIEDMACEIYCQSRGNKGLLMHLEMFGLEEYKKKTGLV